VIAPPIGSLTIAPSAERAAHTQVHGTDESVRGRNGGVADDRRAAAERTRLANGRADDEQDENAA